MPARLENALGKQLAAVSTPCMGFAHEMRSRITPMHLKESIELVQWQYNGSTIAVQWQYNCGNGSTIENRNGRVMAV